MFRLPAIHERSDPFPTVWIEMTPELARIILDNHNRHNRSKKPSRIRRMSNAMRRGAFLRTHQGIAFSSDGILLDGQNRLHAVVDSGVSILLKVSYGVDRISQRAMDNGSKRTDSELQRFGFDRDVDNRGVAVTKAMHSKGTRSEYDPDELHDVLVAHGAAINFALDLFKARGVGVTAPVVAVVARAYYTVDHDTLADFARVVQGGHFSPEESAAAALQKALLKANRRGGSSVSRMFFAMTVRALEYFIEHEPKTIIRPLHDNVFPLPEEMGDEDSGPIAKVA